MTKGIHFLDSIIDRYTQGLKITLNNLCSNFISFGDMAIWISEKASGTYKKKKKKKKKKSN